MQSERTLYETLDKLPDIKNKSNFIKHLEDMQNDITKKLAPLIPDMNDILPHKT